MPDIDVLVAGCGPVGLTAAIELRRRGVDVRIVDPLLEPPVYAKAVGVQPRTLEVYEGMGVLRQMLDAAVEMQGQIVYVNGEQVARLDIAVPRDVPFGFMLMPQYATERILRERLADLGTTIERGIGLAGFEQDDDGVTATLIGPDGEQSVRAGYLAGCDGAHSTVRKALGLSFEGAAFEEQYMLGDVAVDWSLPHNYGVRSMHQTDGKTDDILVCIPIPGRGRYRMSMLVPDELALGSAGADGVAHGFEGPRAPELSHIQAVVDRLSPEPATVSDMRWSSVFRISHRIAGSYGHGRVFIAGDAAHIHPPTGGQGMNTGIQDAHNLAWKLALAVRGDAAGGLLASYDAERRPVGEEVVGRTVRSAREGIGADSTDPDFIVRREAQLLIDYADSPIVAAPSASFGPQPGQRAPDATGLSREMVTNRIRLFTLLGRLHHTVLLHVDGDVDLAALESLADDARHASHGRVDVYVIAALAADVGDTELPIVRDIDGEFATRYAAKGPSVFVLRPDGYLGYRGPVDAKALIDHLQKTFAPANR